jgi:hypothetical protein
MEVVQVTPDAGKSQSPKESAGDDDKSGDGKEDPKKKPAVRKRTKTGCLSRFLCSPNTSQAVNFHTLSGGAKD